MYTKLWFVDSENTLGNMSSRGKLVFSCENWVELGQKEEM